MNTQHIRILVFSFICLITSITSSGQSENIKYPLPIEVITKQTESKTLLRWAFKSPSKWYPNRNISFDIYRANLADGKDKKYIPIAQNITVATKESLEEKFADDDSNIGVGAILQATYGEWESQGEGKSGFGILDKKDELDNKYLTLLYACDIDWQTAELAGLGYKDETTDFDKDYIYRFVPSDTSFLMKHIIAEKNQSPELKISDWFEKENQIVFGWSRYKYENAYTGFFIEKSKNGSTYKRVNDVPYVHLESDDFNEMKLILWQDSVVNYQPIYYRIVGIDAFGEESPPSESIRLQGRDRTAPAVPKGEVSLHPDQTHVDISWSPNIDDDINSYVIRKTYKANGLYKEVDRVAKSVMKIKDKEVELVRQTYYQICAVDTAKNYACSDPLYLVLDDKIAPAAPQNLAGKIDSNGVVRLIWDLGDEPDLMGYYVQVSNGTGRVFTSLTPKEIKMNIWSDTIPLDVLTEDIYYRVNAVDLRSNTSDFSEIIRLEKPDIVPPNASVFNGYKVQDSSILVTFVQSSSKDVEKIILQRKTGRKDFAEIAQITDNQEQYTDDRVISNTQYTYRLVTQDDAGNTTLSPSNLIVTTKNITSKSSVDLVLVEESESSILKWKHQGPTPKYVKLYKGNFQNLRPLKTLKADRTDYAFTPKKGEEYRVRIFFADGTKSSFSNVVKI